MSEEAHVLYSTVFEWMQILIKVYFQIIRTCHNKSYLDQLCIFNFTIEIMKLIFVLLWWEYCNLWVVPLLVQLRTLQSGLVSTEN